MIYSEGGAKNPTKNIPVDKSLRKVFCINDEEVLKLAQWAAIIEDHYSKEAGHFKPWTWNGPRTVRRVTSTSFRHARRPFSPKKITQFWRTMS